MDIINAFEEKYNQAKSLNAKILKNLAEDTERILDEDYIERKAQEEVKVYMRDNREDPIVKEEEQSIDKRIEQIYDMDEKYEKYVDNLEDRINILLEGMDIPEPKLKILDAQLKPKLNKPAKKRHVSCLDYKYEYFLKN